MQSVETPTLTPDDHLFLFSTAVDTIQKIVELPEQQLHALLEADGCAYQHGLLAGYLFILENKISSLLAAQQIEFIATHYRRDYTILPADLGRSNIGDACRHSAHIPEAPGQGGIHLCDKGFDHECSDSVCDYLNFGFCIYMANEQGAKL